MSDPSALQVHRATARDLEGLRKLCADASREPGPFTMGRREPFDPSDWTTGRVAAAVASTARGPVAFAAGLLQDIPWGAPRCAELAVYVPPSFRRRGAGRMLVAELLAVARTMGLWKFTACALPEDPAARALLSRFDFREVGVLVKHVQIEGGWRDVGLYERLIMAARRSMPGG